MLQLQKGHRRGRRRMRQQARAAATQRQPTGWTMDTLQSEICTERDGWIAKLDLQFGPVGLSSQESKGKFVQFSQSILLFILCPKLLSLENPFEFIWNLNSSFEIWKLNLNLKKCYPLWKFISNMDSADVYSSLSCDKV
jgi:hypothetical protein